MPVFLLCLCLFLSCPLWAQTPCTGSISGSGNATYYNYTPGAGACSYAGDDTSSFVAAMNTTGNCGRWIRVTGPLGTVDVQIVDVCPECPAGNIDLNQPAFEQIGNIIDGVIPITWESIPGTEPGGVSIYQVPGSSQWWMALSPRNMRYPVSSLEVRTGGVWTGTTLDSANRFIWPGGGSPLDNPFDVRMVDVHGDSITVLSVNIDPGATQTSSEQFPYCAEHVIGVPHKNPLGLVFHSPEPNPFTLQTSISFELAKPGVVSLRVYDISGRTVRTLISHREYGEGEHHEPWDGRDDGGLRVGAGVYFARLEAGGGVLARRVTLLH